MQHSGSTNRRLPQFSLPPWPRVRDTPRVTPSAQFNGMPGTSTSVNRSPGAAIGTSTTPAFLMVASPSFFLTHEGNPTAAPPAFSVGSLIIPVQRIVEEAISRALGQEAAFSMFSKEMDRLLLQHMAYGLVEAVCWTVNQHDPNESASTWKRKSLRAWAAARRADARCVLLRQEVADLLNRCREAEARLCDRAR
ncbi:hypothetical protein V8E36_005792 [Tilletia maclaganii]